MRVTALSPCPCIAHPVSCLIDATPRPIQTRFRFASGCHCLKLATSINLLAHSPKGTLSDCYILQPVVSTRFQILFHSPRRGSFHLSVTVLVHYRSSSVFSLGRWSSQLPTGLACPVVLRILLSVSQVHLRGSHPVSPPFPERSVPLKPPKCSPTTPPTEVCGLGSSAFARHYSRNTYLFLGLMRCFSSPGSPALRRSTSSSCWVSPFGHHWL